jgi:hypothetical protein
MPRRNSTIALSMLAAMALLSCGRHNDQTSAKTVETDYGDKFEILSSGWVKRTDTGRDRIYSLTVAAPDGMETEERQKLQARVFEEVAGPQASALGFRRVIVDLAGPNDAHGFNLFGVSISVDASAGSGPLPKADFYEEAPDGAWHHNGDEGPPIECISTSKIKAGVNFCLEYRAEDFPRATYVYDCVSCAGDAQSELLFNHIYEMLNEIVLPDADQEGLTSLHVAVFLGPRRTHWQFPACIGLKLEKHSDGRWWGPIASPAALVREFNRQMAEVKDEGRSMRGLK